jgi:hypothetical protein
MQQKSRLFYLLGGLAICILFLSPTEGAAAGKPSITIHNIIDLTGAYAPIAIPSEKGGKDYLAWIAEKKRVGCRWRWEGRCGSQIRLG